MTPANVQGAQAASSNIDFDGNPYLLGSQERVDWFEGWMSIADYGVHMLPEVALYESIKAAWKFVGDLDAPYTGEPSPACGRNRIHLCANKKHMCEKCHFCPEDGAYSPAPL
jgi:hypothetical protein